MQAAGKKAYLQVFVSTRIGRDKVVDLLNGVPQLVICITGWQFELHNQQAHVPPSKMLTWFRQPDIRDVQPSNKVVHLSFTMLTHECSCISRTMPCYMLIGILPIKFAISAV